MFMANLEVHAMNIFLHSERVSQPGFQSWGNWHFLWGARSSHPNSDTLLEAMRRGQTPKAKEMKSASDSLH